MNAVVRGTKGTRTKNGNRSVNCGTPLHRVSYFYFETRTVCRGRWKREFRSRLRRRWRWRLGADRCRGKRRMFRVFFARRPHLTTPSSQPPRKRTKGWIVGGTGELVGSGTKRGAHGAGFNELFHPPLVPPLNRRFHRRFSNRPLRFSRRSINVHVRRVFAPRKKKKKKKRNRRDPCGNPHPRVF